MQACCVKEKEHENVVQKNKMAGYAQGEVEQACGLFRVLSDPTRMKIVLALLQGDLCVYHLTELCGGTQSAISHQLRVLRDNQIVKAKRLGQSVEYSIADAHVKGIVEMGLAHLHCKTE